MAPTLRRSCIGSAGVHDPVAAAAAWAAGVGRVIVVDNPAGRLAEHLPQDIEVAVQAEPRGTGDAVAAGAALLARGGGSCW